MSLTPPKYLHYLQHNHGSMNPCFLTCSFFPIPLCHWGARAVRSHQWVLLPQSQSRPGGMQERAWCPKPASQTTVTPVTPGDQGLYTTEFLGESFGGHAQWHLFSCSQNPPPWGVGAHSHLPQACHPSRCELSPHWSVMTVSATHFLCQALSELTRIAAMTRERWHGHRVLHLALLWPSSGKLRHLPV